MSKVKSYKVAFWYTEYGTTTVEAKDEDEAREIVREELADNGLELIDYRTNDREYSAEDVEEIK